MCRPWWIRSPVVESRESGRSGRFSRSETWGHATGHRLSVPGLWSCARGGYPNLDSSSRCHGIRHVDSMLPFLRRNSQSSGTHVAGMIWLTPLRRIEQGIGRRLCTVGGSCDSPGLTSRNAPMRSQIPLGIFCPLHHWADRLPIHWMRDMDGCRGTYRTPHSPRSGGCRTRIQACEPWVQSTPVLGAVGRVYRPANPGFRAPLVLGAVGRVYRLTNPGFGASVGCGGA
jgi:hypothetical protein